MWIFKEDQILTEDNRIVMHEWEHPLMKAKADWVCQNGGNILELGFGMGISASYIQEHKINSHTICENNPEVLERLREWAKDKPNVIVLEGDWYDNVPQMHRYDGILMDTYNDMHWYEFPDILPNITNITCAVTWWNACPAPYYINQEKLPNTEFKVFDIDPPENDYFNHKHYFLPKCIFEVKTFKEDIN